MNRILPAIMIFALCASVWGAPHAFQVEDMQKLSRLGDAQLSPDGNWVVFTVQQSDVSKNKSIRNLWLIASKGGNPTQLTFATEKGSNSSGRWSPDSKYIYFISSRVEDTPQIFRMSLSGGEAKQITKFALGVDSYVISPDGKLIAFSSTVYPQCSDPACNEKKKKEVEENPVKAQIITSVPFRRWDTWTEGKRNHIFVIPSDGGDAKDLTPGDIDSPIWSEAGGQEFDFSPDSKEICFSRFTESEGFSGNSDLFIIPVQGGNPKQITTNPAPDFTPLYSPDGNYIAYSATLRPGLETDLVRLFLYDRKSGRQINLFEKLDRPIGSYVWSSDAKALWITIEDQGAFAILKMNAPDGKTTRFYADGTNADLQVSKNSKFATFTHNDISHPSELFKLDLSNSSKPVQITNFNTEFLKEIQMGEYSSFTFAGWQGENVQCWQIKPPFFDPNKKYPLVLLMHGGPEGEWENLFHYRWNPQLFAAAGYVVIEPNFHGSTGFGLNFMDAIKGQWGGAPYEDQMKAVDVATTWPYVDRTRLVVAGASYGGYMANWIEGHTDRFRAIVSHDGLYDLNTALYAADFPGGTDKEFKGTPWENPEALLQHSPATYAKNFKTPMLVIHGLKDYRVDPSNGFAMFQVLQAMKVPSKFLLYPDENHWVLKPANNILWYHTAIDWLNYWSKPDQQQYQSLWKQESSKIGGAP